MDSSSEGSHYNRPISLRPWLLLPLLLLCRPYPEAAPQSLGMWYWHTPFRITDGERASLGRMGVRTLYVRAGTFSSDGKRAVTILPQRWETIRGPNVEIVLTMNFDPGLVSHLETIPAETLARDVADGLLAARRKSPPSVGFQLDVDCPTRLLPRYADLLRRVRSRLNAPLSITALPTWLGSSGFGEVAAAVDEVVPQFYENRTGRTLDALEPVSDPAALGRDLARLRSLGVPCRVGLAAYGHALIYDPKGRLAGMYRGLSPEDALRHPALRFERADDLEGERRLVLRAVGPDRQGRGVGARIAYVLPTPAALRRQLAVYRAWRPPQARGPVLYRFPEPGEAMALSLSAIEAALAGRRALPDLAVSLKARAAPWALIAPGKGAARPPTTLRIRAAAVGAGPSEAAPGAVQLLLRLDRPGVAGVAPGDFDSAESGTLDETGRFVRGSGLRADVVLLRRGQVLPGEVLRSGAVETVAEGATSATVEWAVRGPDGNARGVSERIPLDTRVP